MHSTTSSMPTRAAHDQPRLFSSAVVDHRGLGERALPSSCCRSRGHRHRHSRESQQIAGSHRELELLIDPRQTSIYSLPQPANRLAPTEVFLDSLAHDLAPAVTQVAGGARVNSATAAAGVIASDVRCDIAFAAGSHKVSRVVGFVRPHTAAARGTGGGLE